MAKKSGNPYSKLIKKSTIGSVIALLLFFIVELATTIHHENRPIPYSEHAVELYSNQTGDDLTDLYVSAINSAKESVVMVIYAMTDPHIIAALRQKSEEGIEVFIVCDAKASQGLARQLPKSTVIKRVGDGLTHQKILLIDNHEVILGSANMTWESLNVHGNLIMALIHPELAAELTKKIRSMDDEGHSTPLLQKKAVAGDQTIELWVLPDDSTAVPRLIELIKSAKKTIKVAMFTWTRIDLTEELIHAHKRGIQVEAVIDRNSGKGASAKIVKKLSSAGIPVKLSTGQGLLHHKFAYIDESILVNGSANWTLNAFRANDDVFMVIYPLSSIQQSKMNTLWTRITNESRAPL